MSPIPRTFTINVTNVNEAPTGLTLTSDSVAENTAVGAIVGTVTATGDPDSSNHFTYSLGSGGDNDSFTIDASTGVLKTKAIFDYETKSAYDISVKVSDPTQAGQSGGDESYTKAFTINVTNVNEAPTGLTLTSDSVAENTAVGAIVGTVTATGDPDSSNHFTYSLGTGGDNDSFTIDASTGVLKTKAIFDYETKSAYDISVKVSDPTQAGQSGGDESYTKAFTINVTNVNEAPTGLTLTSDSVAENTAVGAIVGTVTATGDPDSSNHFTYSLGTGGDNDSFTIDASTGVLKTKSIFDYETKSAYDISVKVSDPTQAGQSGGDESYTKAFTINVTNVNEAPTGLTLTSDSVAENTAVGAIVGTVTATGDPDSSNHFTYSLGSGGDNDSFTIDASTGVLKTKAIFDYETKSAYDISVKVSDPTQAGQSGGDESYTKDFTINVTNVNEAPTGLTLTSDSVAENTAVGAIVGTVTATGDPDSSNHFTYSLGTGGDNDSFTIDPSTGVLKTKAIFDYETKSAYDISVKVSDPTQAGQSGGDESYTKAFTINVTNVNEAPTGLTLTSDSVAENTAVGAVVGTVTATGDPDSSNHFTYSLGTGGDNDSFTIDPSTGVLKTKSIFDYETKSAYDISVKVSDPTQAGQSGGDESYTKAFTINVTNVNEAPTGLTLTSDSVAENTAVGAIVGTVTATGDPDSSNHFTYSLGTGGDNDSFTIDPSTGVLKTKAIFDYETKSAYDISVKVSDPTQAGQSGGDESYTKAFTINVTNVNEAPTGLTLTSDSVAENTAVGAIVGTVTATGDPDSSNHFTYSSGQAEITIASRSMHRPAC